MAQCVSQQLVVDLLSQCDLPQQLVGDPLCNLPYKPLAAHISSQHMLPCDAIRSPEKVVQCPIFIEGALPPPLSKLDLTRTVCGREVTGAGQSALNRSQACQLRLPDGCEVTGMHANDSGGNEITALV
eukprot:g62099.t1